MNVSVPSETAARLSFDVKCTVGESPVWDAARTCLWWVDVGDSALWCSDLEGKRQTRVTLELAPSFVAISVSGRICVAAGQSWHVYDIETQSLTETARPDAAPTPDWRMNDGVVDAQGRIWTGSIALPRNDQNRGALFRSDRDGVHMLEDDLLTQNGLAISPDGTTLYLADSHPTRALIWAYDFDPATGDLSNRRVFHRCQGGRPDGAAMDIEGGYWFALIDGGQVLRLDPQGQVTHSIKIPASRPTNICFAGHDLRQAFVTSMRAGLDDADLETQPGAGGVFSFRAPIAGAPVPKAGLFAELASNQHGGQHLAPH